METSARITKVKAAFETRTVVLRLDALHSSRPLPGTATSSKKFLQILASIATVGLVEPLIVVPDSADIGCYRILDGRLRVEALKRLNIEEAMCLISTDDEAYTYNKHVNRLTPAQDARMIAKAVERGVPRDRIASVLGVDTYTIKRRAGLLQGICPEAASLLADKNCPGTTFSAIKLMKPIRQLEAAELMCGQGNFSSAFAKAILAATPENQLERPPSTTGKSEDDLTTQLARLEKELATLQTNAALTDEQYGIDQLHLTVSATYIASLLKSDAVSEWLMEKYPEIAVQFQAIAHGIAAPTEHKKTVKLQFKRRQHATGPIN
jgi:hypothetical protein